METCLKESATLMGRGGKNQLRGVAERQVEYDSEIYGK